MERQEPATEYERTLEEIKLQIKAAESGLEVADSMEALTNIIRQFLNGIKPATEFSSSKEFRLHDLKGILRSVDGFKSAVQAVMSKEGFVMNDPKFYPEKVIFVIETARIDLIDMILEKENAN